jgi:ABC-type sugar transport system ATPase subunit
MVEIAKEVSYNSRIIVMDEPTSSITESEAENLFAIPRKLKGMGIAVIYISHKLEELLALADLITILRDGHVIKTEKPENLTRDDLIRLMVGREINDIFPPKNADFGEVVLEPVWWAPGAPKRSWPSLATQNWIPVKSKSGVKG